MNKPYEILERTHPSYTYLFHQWNRCKIFEDINIDAICDLVVTKRPDEQPVEHQERKRLFTYTPLVNFYTRLLAAALSSSPVTIKAKNLDKYIKDIGGKGVDINSQIDILFNKLLWYSKVFITIDTSQGYPCWKFLNPIEVIDWGEGWYKTKQLYSVRLPDSDRYFLRYTYYTDVSTTTYELEVILKDGKPAYTADRKPLREAVFPCVHEDNHNVTCQLVCIELPNPSMWLGKVLIPKQIQYSTFETAWSMSGSLAGQMQRIFTPATEMNNDPRIVYEPSYDRNMLGTQKVLVGAGYNIVESTGAALGNLTSALAQIEQAMRDITCQQKVGEASQSISGVSRAIDAEGMNATLRHYGAVVRKGIDNLLTRTQMLMGLKSGVEVIGLSDFEVTLLDKLISNTQSIIGMGEYIPPTVRKEYLFKLSKALLGVTSNRVLDAVSQELDINEVSE